MFAHMSAAVPAAVHPWFFFLKRLTKSQNIKCMKQTCSICNTSVDQGEDVFSKSLETRGKCSIVESIYGSAVKASENIKSYLKIQGQNTHSWPPLFFSEMSTTSSQKTIKRRPNDRNLHMAVVVPYGHSWSENCKFVFSLGEMCILLTMKNIFIKLCEHITQTCA